MLSRFSSIALGFLTLSANFAAANTTPQVNLTQDWSNAALITTNSWSGVPGIVGRDGSGLTTLTNTDPQTITADYTVDHVIPNQTNPNTLTSGGTAEFDGLANPVVALNGSNGANAPFLLLTLDTTGQQGITIAYNLRDLDSSTDNANSPVALQYRIGTSGTFTNLPAGFVADATSGPSLATLVTPVSVLLPPTLSYLPVVQLRIITSNSSGNDEWIGVDDIRVTSTPPCFVSITSGIPPLGLASAAWGDADGDGDLDLVVMGTDGSLSQESTLLTNSVSGTPPFAPSGAALPGTILGDLTWGEYDGDGDLDLLLTGSTTSGDIARVFAYSGGLLPGRPSGITGVQYSAGAWGDVDNDGDQDIAVAGNTAGGPAASIYRSPGGSLPTLINMNAGLTGVGDADVSFCDYDNDDDLDLLVTGASPFIGGTLPSTTLYRNSGGRLPTFTEVNVGLVGVTGGSSAWGDYDADGDADLLIAGVIQGNNRTARVYRNSGGANPAFTDIGAPLTGASSGSVAWADYDHDGDLDILVAGYDGTVARTNFYRSSGGSNPTFEMTDDLLIGLRSGDAVFGDYDGDHDLDLVVVGESPSPFIYGASLYRNVCGPANAPPSAPTALSVSFVDTVATFSWSASTDDRTPTAALTYNMRVGTTPNGSEVLSALAHPTGLRRVVASGNVGQRTSHTIRLKGTGPWYWSVQAIDASFEGSAFAPEQAISVSAVTETAAPGSTALWSSGPNPFSARTGISFRQEEGGHVSLLVFDVVGRLVRQLLNETRTTGEHTVAWDGRDDAGLPVRSGAYFVRMAAESGVRTLRLDVAR